MPVISVVKLRQATRTFVLENNSVFVINVGRLLLVEESKFTLEKKRVDVSNV